MENEQKIIKELRKKGRYDNRLCYTPGCNNKAISSHIQQENGSVIQIASKSGEVIELLPTNADYSPFLPYIFKKTHISRGQALTFLGFCSSCDQKIFKEIESKTTNLSLYRNQLLFSYRGFLSEHFKQEGNVKWYELIFNSDKIIQKTKDTFKQRFLNFTLSAKSGRLYKLLMEKDLNENTENFEFIHFKLPKIDVCTSTVYSIPRPMTFSPQQIFYLFNFDTLQIFTDLIFVNLIPSENELNVIIGSAKESYGNHKIDLQYIEKLGEAEKIKFISDLLIKHIETWVVSIELHDQWKSKKKDIEILNQIKKYWRTDKLQEVDFNMFF